MSHGITLWIYVDASGTPIKDKLSIFGGVILTTSGNSLLKNGWNKIKSKITLNEAIFQNELKYEYVKKKVKPTKASKIIVNFLQKSKKLYDNNKIVGFFIFILKGKVKEDAPSIRTLEKMLKFIKTFINIKSIKITVDKGLQKYYKMFKNFGWTKVSVSENDSLRVPGLQIADFICGLARDIELISSENERPSYITNKVLTIWESAKSKGWIIVNN